MPLPLQEALDLHAQPLANGFKKEASEALAAPRFPLRLMRCTVCNHMHLSYMVDRKELFADHYLYVSGTSKTLLVRPSHLA